MSDKKDEGWGCAAMIFATCAGIALVLWALSGFPCLAK